MEEFFQRVEEKAIADDKQRQYEEDYVNSIIHEAELELKEMKEKATITEILRPFVRLLILHFF